MLLLNSVDTTKWGLWNRFDETDFSVSAYLPLENTPNCWLVHFERDLTSVGDFLVPLSHEFLFGPAAEDINRLDKSVDEFFELLKEDQS